jgi:hypothetical protein
MSADEAYLMVKLPPRLTGLPMAVWITANESSGRNYVRVEVSKTHGVRGRWLDAAAVVVRSHPREVTPGSLTETDFVAVSRWIELNQALIVDYWDGWLEIDEVLQRLQRLP